MNTELLTSAQVNKLLKQLNSEKELILREEKEKYEFHAATIKDPETLRPEYDSHATQEKIAELNAKIRKLKHSINIFNTTFVIPEFDMTIDEMLIYIPQLSREIQKLEMMRSKQEKMRAPSRPGLNYIDYIYINYPIDQPKEDYDRIAKTLSAAQIALDTVNNTETFEVEL